MVVLVRIYVIKWVVSIDIDIYWCALLKRQSSSLLSVHGIIHNKSLINTDTECKCTIIMRELAVCPGASLCEGEIIDF